MYYDRLANFAVQTENRLGTHLWPFLVSLAAILAASVYARPAWRCVSQGLSYANLSKHPFAEDFTNKIAFRILTPLVSHLLGFQGHSIIIFNLIVATVFLYLMYRYFRKITSSPGDGLVSVILFAFSLVTLTTVYYGGYTDSTTYLLVFLMWWFRPRRFFFYLLFFLALLNHEAVLFLVPWFLYISFIEMEHKGRWCVDSVVGFGVTVGLFFLYRQWWAARGDILFDLSYYLNPLFDDPLYWFEKSFPFQGLGFFSVFKLLWILPALTVVSLWREGDRRPAFSIIFLLLCVGLQLFVAYDSSRIFTLGFPAMIISLEYLFKTDAFEFRKWVPALIVVNLFVPQLYTAAGIVEKMFSTIEKVVMLLLFENQIW